MLVPARHKSALYAVMIQLPATSKAAVSQRRRAAQSRRDREHHRDHRRSLDRPFPGPTTTAQPLPPLVPLDELRLPVDSPRRRADHGVPSNVDPTAGVRSTSRSTTMAACEDGTIDPKGARVRRLTSSAVIALATRMQRRFQRWKALNAAIGAHRLAKWLPAADVRSTRSWTEYCVAGVVECDCEADDGRDVIGPVRPGRRATDAVWRRASPHAEQCARRPTSC